MKVLNTWMRRTLTVGAVLALATTGLAPTSATASPEPALAQAAAVDAVDPAGDVGVQHVGQTWFTGFGCTYHGRSGPAAHNGQHFATTAITRGSGCRSAMVRAYVCGSGSCWTTNWISGSQPEYWAPKGAEILISYHKCSGCTLTSEVHHH
ncbi:MAG TPA: hypothetical protein VIL37_15320 [Natronosporangium sp.]